MTENPKLERKALAKPLVSIRHEPTEPVRVPSAVAIEHGFDRVPVPLPRWSGLRRTKHRHRRVASGRTLQFNVKLVQPTIDYIYEIANTRDIPLAQVIEEFVELHRSASR